MENVNKQLLAAAKLAVEHGLDSVHIGSGVSVMQTLAAAIAAAEQAQQAEPVCATCNGAGFTGDALTLCENCPDCQQAEPVAWEYREFHDDNTVTPGWGKWKRIESEEWAGRAIKSVVADIHEFIAQGYRYELRALYAQPPAVAVPDGYALVPIDPTSKMLMAADRVIWADADILGNYCNLWNAMLAASQKDAK